MKSPDHPIPSGDRQIARLIQNSLQKSGHRVDLVSTLRSWHKTADANWYQQIEQEAKKIADNYLHHITDETKPDIWLTYHLYHKAPDWLGPYISKALNIPYYVIEASYAQSKIGSIWQKNLEITAQQIQSADRLYCFHERDYDGLSDIVSQNQLFNTPPFIDLTTPKTDARRDLAKKFSLPIDDFWLCSVAMMRDGDKFQSFQELAQIMKQFPMESAKLLIIGDGKKRNEVEALFDHRAIFLGKMDPAEIMDIYSACDLYIWPAIGEAIGLAMLEAQSQGLPALCGKTTSTEQFILHNRTGYLYEKGNITEALQYLKRFTQLTDSHQAMSNMALQHITKNHSPEAFLKALSL